MQFSQLAGILAIAATVAASPVPNQSNDGADGWGSACKKGKEMCKESSDQCSKDGGVSYKCTTIGLVNLLNCFSLLDGNTISIPVTIDLLSGDTIPLSA